MPKAKPYSGPIDEKLAAQLLNSTGTSFEDKPLGNALIEATRRLDQIVETANSALGSNEFATIVAEHLAAKKGRRGHARVFVSEGGKVLLEISYEDDSKKGHRPRAQRSSALPLMAELKARAKELGVDISSFGIKRKKIHEYLQEVAQQSPAKKARSSEDAGPMSAGPDETKVIAAPDPKPPRRGFMKTGEAISSPVIVEAHPKKVSAKPANKPEGSKGRSLRELVEAAAEVDISTLLESDPPE